MPAILVIDDDRSVCLAVETILKASGYSVAITADGHAGLDAAAGQPFAAAIVDLCMPIMQGLDVIRALRTLAPDMPLVAMSGLISDWAGNTPDFLGMSASLNGVHRLGKPFRQEDLLAVVAKCCASGHSAADDSASCAA